MSAPVEVTEELLDFVRHRETIQHRNAVAIQPKLRRKRHGHPIRSRPVNGRTQVLRGQVQSEAVGIAQATVHFKAGLKFLRAKGAFVRAGGKPQRPARPECIAELPRIAGKVFFRNEVFADVPTANVAAQNQFELNLALVVHVRQPVRHQKIRQAIVADHLANGFVGAGVFKFGIEAQD